MVAGAAGFGNGYGAAAWYHVFQTVRMSTRITAAITAAAIFAAAFFGYVRCEERETFFSSYRGGTRTPSDDGMSYRDVRFLSTDGTRLHGWFIPSAVSPYVVLACHGRRLTMGELVPRVRFFHDLGVATFLFDYRGYGESEGTPGEQGFYRDAEAAYRYLTQTLHIAPDRIIVYGVSLGGAVAIDLASKVPARGLMLEGTFTSVRDLAGYFKPWIPRFLVRDLFDSASKVARVSEPTVIFHSKDDATVPFVLGKRLSDEFGAQARFVPIAGKHADACLASRSQCAAVMHAFIETPQGAK